MKMNKVMMIFRAGHATTLLRQCAMLSGHKIVGYCILTIFVVANLQYLDTETLTFFLIFGLLKLYYIVALSFPAFYCVGEKLVCQKW